MNLSRMLSFKNRVVIAFLLVPWLPIVFLVPYSIILQSLHLLERSRVDGLIYLWIILATFTYLLEIFVLLPIWHSMQRSGKTSLLRFAAIGFGLAFASAVIVMGIFTGAVFLIAWKLAILIPLFGVIGSAEAVVFWLIVRPDKQVANTAAPSQV